MRQQDPRSLGIGPRAHDILEPSPCLAVCVAARNEVSGSNAHHRLVVPHSHHEPSLMNEVEDRGPPESIDLCLHISTHSIGIELS